MPHMMGHWGWVDPNPQKENPLTGQSYPAYVDDGSGRGGDVADRPTDSLFGSSSSFGGGSSAGSMDPYMSTLMGLRGAGGTGGGSSSSEGNMDANDLISLSEYLGENVTSFEYGGKMNNPYQYNMGGTMGNTMNQLSAIEQINNIARANQGMEYAHGGGYLGNVNAPMANKGMEYNYGGVNPYAEGGNFPHNMYDPETGYKIAAQNEGMHNKLNKKGFTHDKPKAAHGMKMKKRYTQGGRF